MISRGEEEEQKEEEWEGREGEEDGGTIMRDTMSFRRTQCSACIASPMEVVCGQI